MSIRTWNEPHFKHDEPPRQLVKAQRKKAEEQHRKAVKAAVWKRDGGRCRVCGDPATEMHELLFRSLMGKRSTENSIAVCGPMTPHRCHRLLQTHAIEVEGKDANKALRFFWADHVPVTHRFFRILSRRRSQQR